MNSELGKFGLHNGGGQDAGLLNEKWESLAVVPVDGKKGSDGEFFVFSVSDNDFITQDGEFASPTPLVFFGGWLLLLFATFPPSCVRLVGALMTDCWLSFFGRCRVS